MAIRCKLSGILGDRRIRMNKLADEAGISRGAIRLLYNDKAQKLDFGILNRLCRYLKVQPGDLLIYVEDTDQEDSLGGDIVETANHSGGQQPKATRKP